MFVKSNTTSTNKINLKKVVINTLVLPSFFIHFPALFPSPKQQFHWSNIEKNHIVLFLNAHSY